MSVIFDGPNKAPKVDAYELAKDLSRQEALSEAASVDLSEFQTPDPGFAHALEQASAVFDKGGVAASDIDPTLGEVMRAAFQQENTLGSLLARKSPEDDTPSLTAQELYIKVENEGLLPFLSNFQGAQTEGEYEAIKSNVQRELQNRRTLDAAGWGGTVATLGAAVLDPVNFVPVGGTAVRVAKLASRGSKAAVESALAGAMGAGLAEAGLQATQETRTGVESAVSVAAGTVLGGVLGIAVDTVFGREIADKAVEHYDNIRTGKAQSGGATAIGDLDKAIDERFSNNAKVTSFGVGRVFEAIEKIPVVGTHLASPARVLSRSYSGAARRAMQMLVSDPSISKGNAAGRKSLDNVEAAFGAVKGQFGEARSELTELFNKNKAAYDNSREAFNTKVAHALASGDKSDDEIVTRAASILRARVFDPIRKSLVDNGVFSREDAELLNAESYFPLVYSPDSVRGDEAAFVEFHEAVFGRTLHEDARQALIAKSIKQSDIEDTEIAHKGVRQRVPKVDAQGNPVINPKTGKQVMTEKIITKGKFRELRDEAMATFDSEAKELRDERDTVLKAFSRGESWPYAGPAELDNPFAKQFEARDKLRDKLAKIDETLRERKAVEGEKLQLRLEQIEARAAEKAEAGIDKGSLKAARKSGKALEKELSKARKESAALVRDLAAKAAKDRSPISAEIAEHEALIKASYGERIDTAKASRDEIIAAADDTARAAILRARGVELDEGVDAIARNYTRGGQISEELIQAEAAKRANALYLAVTKGVDPLIDHEVIGSIRGYAKTRKNPADHVTLMQKGWALSDVMAVTDRYTKTAGTDSVLGQFFKKEVNKVDQDGGIIIGPDGKAEKTLVADVALTSVRAKIEADYAGMLSNAVPPRVIDKLTRKHAKDPVALESALKAAKIRHEKELMARRDTDIQSLDTLLNFTRGKSANPGSQRLREAAEMVGIFNYVRLMGGQIVSSLGDPLNLVISQGLGNTVRHGVVPILRDFKAALRSADGDARRLARLSGANLEMEFNATMAEIGGFTNPWVHSKDKLHWARVAAEKFSAVNGIKYWNTLWKQVAYNTTQARLIENASKGWGSASASERAWMASLGVDEGRLNDFAHYFEQQTSKTVAGGMPLARWDEWADKAAGEAFRAAVYKESFNVVITPGMYDRLNAHSNPIGRIILQFRNHMFANTARLTARNAQLASLGLDKTGAVMTGFTGLLMMGAVIDATKQALGDVTATGDTVSGEAVIDQVIQRWEEAPAQQLYNVNDRIGWLGPVFEASNVLHGTSGMGLQDLLRVMGGEEPIGTSRLGQRSVLDVAGGATAGLLSDTVATVKAVGSAAFSEDKDLSLGDVKRMERLMLPMSLPYLRPFINEFNQHVGTQYDWPTGSR